MKTSEINSKGDLVTVEWERGYLTDESLDRNSKIYETTGIDNNNSLWFGSWVEVDDKLEMIGEINQE